MTSPTEDFPELPSFDHAPRTRLIFGVGCVQRAGELARSLGGTRVLLVTDPGIAKAGHASHLLSILEHQQLSVVLYDRVHENPSTRDVDDCLEVAKHNRIDLIVGLGGGSSLDTAKGCNFLLTNGGRMQDYQGVGKATRPMLPLIAIPTTSGTGSECQSAALIADEETHQKMACLDPKAAAKIAILDPALTVSQPLRVTACTGLDAIAHAVETAVTNRRNSISGLYSREAFHLCIRSFETVLREPDDLAARGRMLLGAALAGLAIENSMLGAAHSAGNPLTAHFGIVHGQAVGMLLPAVIRYNAHAPAAAAGYAELARAAGLEPEGGLLRAVSDALRAAGMPRSLKECGVQPKDLPGLAGEASRQWTAHFNPRPIGVADFQALFEEAMEER